MAIAMAKKKARPAKKPAKSGKAGRSASSEVREVEPTARNLDSMLKEMTAEPERRRLEQWLQVQCPYCGEDFEIHATSEDEGQTMTEDCHVCCRPVSLHVHAEDDELQVSAYRS